MDYGEYVWFLLGVQNGQGREPEGWKALSEWVFMSMPESDANIIKEALRGALKKSRGELRKKIKEALRILEE